jgi:basic amino acid/polyamine antiporter, APA family
VTQNRGGLGLGSATALVISHTIAVGIFLTPAELIGGLASPALTFALWIGCSAIVLSGAFTFGELASRHPKAGGLYVYLREAWGPLPAFLYGWQALLVMDPGITAALAAGAAQYVVVIWTNARGFEHLIAVGVIWIGALLNLAGLTFGARIFAALTALKLATLGGIIIGAFTIGEGSWTNFGPVASSGVSRPPVVEALVVGLIGAFFSFGGFWETSRIAGDVREPGRTLPRALVYGVSAVTAIYLMTTAAFIYLVPPAATTSAAEFARQAGQALAGPVGPTLLAAIVLVSVSASVIAMIMVAPRLYEAMGRDGLFPRAVAVRSAGTGAPVRATLLLAVLASTFAILGTFDQIVAFFVCTTLALVALAAAAIFIERRRRPAEGTFRTPGYPVTPALFLLLVGIVVLLIGVNRPVQAGAGLVIVLLGLPVHRLVFAKGASSAGKQKP